MLPFSSHYLRSYRKDDIKHAPARSEDLHPPLTTRCCKAGATGKAPFNTSQLFTEDGYWRSSDGTIFCVSKTRAAALCVDSSVWKLVADIECASQIAFSLVRASALSGKHLPHRAPHRKTVIARHTSPSCLSWTDGDTWTRTAAKDHGKAAKVISSASAYCSSSLRWLAPAAPVLTCTP